MTKQLVIIDAIKFGYSKTIEHFGLLMKAYGLRLAISFCISTVINTLLSYVQHDASYYRLLQVGFAKVSLFSLSIAHVFFYYIMTLGLTHIALNIYDRKQTSIYALLSDWRLIINYLAAMFLFWIILAASLSLFIIPGAVIVVTKQYVSFLGASVIGTLCIGFIMMALCVSFRMAFFLDQIIVDKAVGPVEALKINFTLTQGALFKLMGLCAVSSSLIILSSLTIIGLIITVPAYLLTRTYAYRKLSALSR